MIRILKKVAKGLSRIDDVRAVILYGGFARGEYTSRSDIDLLIFTTRRETEREIQERVIKLESEIGRSIQPTIRTIGELEKTDTGLLQNIFQEGKILYLKEPVDVPSAMLLEQKPYLIYSFQINSLTQKDKVRFNRQLYEQTRKGYKYKGLLQEIRGEKLSPGCIAVPYAKKAKIEKFFEKFKVKFEHQNVWK